MLQTLSIADLLIILFEVLLPSTLVYLLIRSMKQIVRLRDYRLKAAAASRSPDWEKMDIISVDVWEVTGKWYQSCVTATDRYDRDL